MSPPRHPLVLLLLAAACGPETAMTDASATTGDASSSSTNPTATASTSEPTTTDATPSSTTTSSTTTSDTTTSDTTAADTTTGAACLEFFTMEHPNEPLPPQFTCGNDEPLCPSDLDVPLFKFETGPDDKDANPTTEDLDRVHCLLEALRDRKRGTFPFELGYGLLGEDIGTIEIAGDFAIWRREITNDFNYDYSERALWLEPPDVFAECRALNTANAAWKCLRRYFLTFPVMAECVEAPLVCPR